MPLPTNINSFLDVKAVLDSAKRLGGGKYKLSSKGQAIHWRMRAYAYRKLLREQMASGIIDPTYHPETPYDSMILRVEDNFVTILFDLEFGELTDLDGNPKEIAPAEIEIDKDDPLLLEAQKLVKDLGDE